VADAAFSIAKMSRLAGPAGRRRALVVTASLALHALVLTPMALGLFQTGELPLIDPEVPPVFLELEPRPLLAGETARTPAFARAPAEDAAPIVSTRASAERTPDLDDDEEAPGPPSPRTAGAAPPGSPPAPADAWRVTGESLGAAVGRSLRTGAGGCRIMDGRLSAGEQALCDERFNEAAGRAGPLGPRTLNASETRRDAGFARDGAQALAQYEARRRPLSGGIGVVGPGDCPGSNLGAGCAGAHLDPALRQGATTVGNPGLRSNDTTPMRPIPGQE
jgi:hypothetical protein